MKNMLRLTAVAALVLSASTLRAADEGKEVTLTGEGKCLKCALHKADKCQNVLEVKDGGKVKTYSIVGKVSKEYHGDNLCSASKKISVTGKTGEKDGTLTIAATKIVDAK
jgi:Family of unknown function (DUF6370)